MKQGELVWLWMALVILGAVTVLAYRSIDSAADTLGWVEHTGKVLQQISEVTAAYSRAVTARRAYVVAGDDSQLADVRDLDERLGRAIGAERASLADNPSQLRSLEAMSRLLEERLSSLDASVAQRRREGVGVETAEGFALTAQIRTIREKMEGEENRLLAERDALTRRDMARTKFAEIIGTLASFAILLFAFNRLRREIARRQQTEQALVASQSFLDSIVENIPNMIFVKEAGELRFERINRAGEQLLGVKRADLVRKNDFDLFPREQAEFFQERDRETLNNKIPVDIAEEPIKTARGERWLHTKKVPVLDAEGVPKYLLGISEDITEQRQAAEALKSAKDAAEAANHELEAFSYSVAHDLRAPLRGINGYSVALVEDIGDKLDGEAKDYLQRISAGATRMGQLIDALLGLSRVSRADLVREPVNVTEMASSVVAQLRMSDVARVVDFVVADGLRAQGDPLLLRALLENLLGNAWKFTSKLERARIEVGRTEYEGALAYFVRDNGAGFDMEYAGKLFAPFQRLHKPTEFSGTGIGLATVQRIVWRHGGKVWAEGHVGRGATFHFTVDDPRSAQGVDHGQ
jgi:PAS domain S-box-containing protein